MTTRPVCVGRLLVALLASLGASSLVILLGFAASAGGTKVDVEQDRRPGADGLLDFQVRDSLTGYGVPASIVVRSAEAGLPFQDARADGAGRGRLQLPEGFYAVDVTAPGHRFLTTRLRVEAGVAWPVTVWVDPDVVPEELQPETVLSKTNPGFALLHGHVVDIATGQPLGGVSLRLMNSGIQGQSNERGYFAIEVPVRPAAPDSLPDTDDLEATLPGYQTYRIRHTPLHEGGDTHFIIDLEPGHGVSGYDDTPKLMRDAEELKEAQSPRDIDIERYTRPRSNAGGTQGLTGPAAPDGAAGLVRPAALVVAPPSSIRVGLNCSCTSCSAVAVMSLETYAKRGLNDEWLASWTPHSLRSGAIPYRSYGAYYVDHPLRPNYDICSTTCCQVNDADTSASTNAAVDATPGLLLERGGGVFRSEYSAENNNANCAAAGCVNRSCVCGNGNAGSPGASWPCLADAVDAGRTCFGHGRGMCQWGTQRWALQGRLWNWLVNHYYNNDGRPAGLRSAFLTSPLEIGYVVPDPGEIIPEKPFVIYVGALNYAELTHQAVMIGASLYSDATGYVSDPADDQPVALAPGSNDVWRLFTLPGWAPSGSYDLIVALWLDVDGDGAITFADVSLVRFDSPGAVTVP